MYTEHSGFLLKLVSNFYGDSTWNDLQQQFLGQKHCCAIVLNGCNIIPTLFCHKLPLRIVPYNITFKSHYTSP